MGWNCHPNTISMASARNNHWFHIYIESAIKNPQLDPIKPEFGDIQKSEIAWRNHWGLNELYEVNNLIPKAEPVYVEDLKDLFHSKYDKYHLDTIHGTGYEVMTREAFIGAVKHIFSQSPSRDEWIKNKLITGRMYYQISCEKWLKYVGKTDKYNDGIWYQFHFDGKLYNELRFENVKSMFDFNKPPKQVSEV